MLVDSFFKHSWLSCNPISFILLKKYMSFGCIKCNLALYYSYQVEVYQNFIVILYRWCCYNYKFCSVCNIWISMIYYENPSRIFYLYYLCFLSRNLKYMIGNHYPWINFSLKEDLSKGYGCHNDAWNSIKNLSGMICITLYHKSFHSFSFILHSQFQRVTLSLFCLKAWHMENHNTCHTFLEYIYWLHLLLLFAC